MNRSNESDILLIGLAGTGKTNFLVALDVVLDTLVDPNGLVHSGHADDRAYVQPLREMWLSGKQLPHTTRQTPTPPHQLLVHHPKSGTHATFHIPDLAGETFDGQFATRSLSHKSGMRLQKATGLILFLHSEDQACHEILEHPLFIDTESTTESPSNPHDQASNWSIERSCKQVKLVDLLQFIAKLRKLPIRIAVVISAWDCIDQMSTGIMQEEPSLFLTKQWPLLFQFLECNRDSFIFRTFGVSARGGGITPEEIERLTSFDHPQDRVFIVDGDHRSNDLTLPVRWLLNLPETSNASNG